MCLINYKKIILYMVITCGLMSVDLLLSCCVLAVLIARCSWMDDFTALRTHVDTANKVLST
jgi:hypothetical protein